MKNRETCPLCKGPLYLPPPGRRYPKGSAITVAAFLREGKLVCRLCAKDKTTTTGPTPTGPRGA